MLTRVKVRSPDSCRSFNPQVWTATEGSVKKLNLKNAIKYVKGFTVNAYRRGSVRQCRWNTGVTGWLLHNYNGEDAQFMYRLAENRKQPRGVKPDMWIRKTPAEESPPTHPVYIQPKLCILVHWIYLLKTKDQHPFPKTHQIIIWSGAKVK